MAKQTVAVLGPGSWGTALAQVLNDNGHDVRLWGNIPEQIDEIPKIAKAIDALVTSAEQERQSYCTNARRAAEDYDFKHLTDKLIAVIESITEK